MIGSSDLAMENWGLIGYGTEFLINENTSSFENKIFRSLTIAHEVSHMWFGDVVTPKWWTYTWLKEGFARLFQHIAIGMVCKATNAFE